MASEVCPLWATDAWVDMWSGFRYPLQEVQTLPKKIQNVFALNQKLDFPLITDICEAAEKRPYEIAESVHLLSQSLREGAGSKLKVLRTSLRLSLSQYSYRKLRIIQINVWKYRTSRTTN